MKYNLSEISALIKNRRTIYPKFYSSRLVHEEIINEIIQNGTWAPNHGNTQPWRFKVYTGDSRIKLGEKLGEIYTECTPKDSFNPEKLNKIKSRPLLSTVTIIVNMQRGDNEKIPVIEEIEAVACAVQNMSLTATAYGLGSFWSTPKIIYTPAMKTFLKLGKEDQCVGLFYLGYPTIQWPKGQRKPIEYLTEWNR